MATVRWHETGTVYRGQTDRILEFLFTKEDGTVVDLTGACGFATFWYQGSAAHATRSCEVDAANGILRLYPDGTEFPTVGDVLFQATAYILDATLGVNRLHQTISHPIIQRRVIAEPS